MNMTKTVAVYYSPEMIKLLNSGNFTSGMCPVDLSLLQRIKLKLFGRVKVFHRCVVRMLPGNYGLFHGIDIYIARCPKHGLFLECLSGVHETCICPKCAQEAAH